ncbi:hypothetical protein [Actinoplanes sp. TFC3]|uniref:hypothetical protein n=1 Tax=Actinoplanes sp. TFC3 TaxID=1710355 RepID=UPI00083264F0|nr:hypothetical protein [Actinoplanes sp. TFC3]
MRLLPVILVLALAGCANGDPAGAPSAPTSGPVAAPPSPPAGQTTISGTIGAGVEPNCLVLDNHLLIIKDEAQKAIARPGASVTVTGREEPQMMTTCMQGTPFIVSAVQAN